MKISSKMILIMVLLLISMLFFVACGDGSNRSHDTAKVTVTFDSCNGKAVQTIKVKPGQPINKPIDPSRIGYTFDGWYVSDKDFSVDTKWLFAGFQVVENTILYAKWLANVCTIEYEANKPNGAAGTLSGLVLFSVHTYGESKSLNTNKYSLTGWDFDSWNTKADGSGTKYTDGQIFENVSINHEDTVILFAQWYSGYASGLGVQSEPFIINTAQQLNFWAQKINTKFNYNNFYFELGANINLGETEWTPISNFYGTLDGNGYIISNFKITKREKYEVEFGFFSRLYGTVENLGLKNFYINISISDSGLNVGGLAGENRGTIANCYAIGNITASAADIYGSGNFVGGLVGGSWTAVKNCFAIGNITGSGYEIRVGGLIGHTSGNIENCFASGNVSAIGSDHADGISPPQLYVDYINCYRYENQVITPANPNGNTCTLEQLNSISFYKNTLGWSVDIWNFNELDFANYKYPSLRIN